MVVKIGVGGEKTSYIGKLNDIPKEVIGESTDIKLSLKILDFIKLEREDITTKAVLSVLEETKELALMHKFPRI